MYKSNKKILIEEIPLKIDYQGIKFKQFMRTDSVLYYQAYWKKDQPLFLVAIVFTHRSKTEANEDILVEDIREESDGKKAVWVKTDGYEAIDLYNYLDDHFSTLRRNKDQNLNDDW